jgi:hypothetical protein
MTPAQEFLMIEFEASIDNMLCIYDKLQGVDYTNDDLDLFSKFRLAQLVLTHICDGIDFEAVI